MVRFYEKRPNKANLNNAGENCKKGSSRNKHLWDTDPNHRNRITPVLVEAQRKSYLNPNRKKVSEEDLKRISILSVDAWKGKHHTKEAKEKLKNCVTGGGPTKGKKWMYNSSGEFLAVPREEVNSYLSNGWILGRKSNWTGFKLSEEAKKKIGEARTGKRRVVHSESKIEKFILLEDLERYLLEGWEIFHPSDEVKKRISEGMKRKSSKNGGVA